MRNTVAIAIPVWKKNLTENEKISFNQACGLLKEFTFILVSYRALDIDTYTNILDAKGIHYKVKYFNQRYFKDVNSYSLLMLSLGFYTRFLFYNYLLIYQVDCFVFRDELRYWVNKEYSYIGAPWVKGYTNPDNAETKVLGVGNGGFSLRRISHHIKALIIYNLKHKKHLIWKLIYERNETNSISQELMEFIKGLLFQNAFEKREWDFNEDYFWGMIAEPSFNWFTVPDWKTAAKFSMEAKPRYFFDMNNHKLPFGCHAWWRYDFAFWMPHIRLFYPNIDKLEELRNVSE